MFSTCSYSSSFTDSMGPVLLAVINRNLVKLLKNVLY